MQYGIFSYKTKLIFFRFSLAGSATEMRVASPYIPTDERFDHVKLSDNKADMVRAAGHAISSKIQAKLSKKTSFESIEEVKKLYAPKGKFDGGINNVLPTKADVSTRDQQPLVFLKELTAKRNDGEKNNILLFPIPQIIQGKLILDKDRDFWISCWICTLRLRSHSFGLDLVRLEYVGGPNASIQWLTVAKFHVPQLTKRRGKPMPNLLESI